MVATHAEFDATMSEAAYRRFALADGTGQWELVEGRLRARPPMSAHHGFLITGIGAALLRQLDPAEYQVRFGHARLRVSPSTYYVPDLVVIPTAVDPVFLGTPDDLDAFADPLPLVVEVWSPSTGGYDIDTKLPEYRARGDLEIWRLHPRDRTLTAWARQPDGGYVETSYAGGIVRPVALPHDPIDLDALFAP